MYRKKTNGMLIEPPYPGAIGEGGYRYINAANMTNNGVELSVAYQGNTGKDFNYQVKGNIAYNKNVVNSLPVSVKYTWGGSALQGDPGIAGHPWGSYYGFISDGIFQSQDEVDSYADQPGKGVGRLKYRELCLGLMESPMERWDYDYDRTWIGDGSTPKFEYGLSIESYI